jgi:dTDP-3-amino-2,3,6-trideoxy-4-keto-D-glucose/dTDP-3-amino-3,4,6-trideoxy-alpha-D-glucose/dTDP-2,6-dideoxy-D-kanosamine transaminase
MHGWAQRSTGLKTPFNDLKRPYDAMAPVLEEALLRAARSGWYMLGPELKRFESHFADYCGIPHALGVGNGTDALEIALRACDCGPGDEVVMAANAGFYAAAACFLTGAAPVFADVEAERLTLSADAVAHVLSPATKAVVATHLYGRVADIAGIRRVIGAGVAVIEDCAQAHGASCATGRAGSLGDMATFSFYPTKNLGALGDGGALCCREDALAERIRHLRQYGWTKKYTVGIPRGRNSRMDETQAAVLCAKLPHLDAWNERRRSIAHQYCAAATGTALNVASNAEPGDVAHLFVARHPERNAFQSRMEERGVATAIHYPILDCDQPALKNLSWRAGDLGVSRKAVHEVISLPCFPELTDAEVEHVCVGIQECA